MYFDPSPHLALHIFREAEFDEARQWAVGFLCFLGEPAPRALTVDPVNTCAGDLVMDGVIDGFDLLALLGCWGPVTAGSECAAADLTGPEGQPDEVVDGFDLLFLLGNWGPCP